MPYSIITENQFDTINWSGGTSTQLYIYPSTANYALKNFSFRLSTAKVNVEKSTFTPLPGVSRKIMILDGEIEICHKNQYNKRLKKFDTDHFQGDWQTSAHGLCTDFNLMTKGKTKGNLEALKLQQDKSLKLPLKQAYSQQFIYLYSGKLSFNLNQNEHLLKQGELLVLDQLSMANIDFYAIKDSDLIITQLSL